MGDIENECEFKDCFGFLELGEGTTEPSFIEAVTKATPYERYLGSQGHFDWEANKNVHQATDNPAIQNQHRTSNPNPSPHNSRQNNGNTKRNQRRTSNSSPTPHNSRRGSSNNRVFLEAETEIGVVLFDERSE